MTDKWIEVTRAVVHPWLCESQQHLNTRHFAALFDEASWLVLAMLGHRRMAEDGIGWADVRHVTEFRREAPVGSFVRVDSHVAKLRRTSVTILHRVVDFERDEIIATFEGVSVCFDLGVRKSRPIPDVVRDTARTLFGRE